MRKMRELLQCKGNREERKGDVTDVLLWHPISRCRAHEASKGLRPLEITFK